MKHSKWTMLYGLAAAGALMLGAQAAHADQIPFSGGATGLSMYQNGSPSTPDLQLRFSGLTVGMMAGDALTGTSVSITPTTTFDLAGPITTNGSIQTANFSPGNGNISIGNATTGTFSGGINFLSIVNPAAGFYNVEMNLSNITVTSGTSALLSTWAASSPFTNGAGTMTFSFSSGPQSLTNLMGIGAGTTLTDSLQGTVTPVPEPASLALLGTGLLALAFVFKRRLHGAPGLDLQS
jgi:hypothetical protein